MSPETSRHTSKQTGKEGSDWRPDGDTSSGPQGGILHDLESHCVQTGEKKEKSEGYNDSI